MCQEKAKRWKSKWSMVKCHWGLKWISYFVSKDLVAECFLELKMGVDLDAKSLRRALTCEHIWVFGDYFLIHWES